MATVRWTAKERGSGPASTIRSKGTGTRVGAPAKKKANAAATAWATWAVAGLTLAAGLVLAGAPGVAGASHAKVVKVGTANVPHLGVVLTTGSGLTLYYFTGDPAGKATCTGGCAKVWPPFMAPKGAHISAPKGVKGLALIKAGNGHWQVAFDHAALYRFEGDSKKGQDKGQGVIGKWYAAMKSGITAGMAPAGAAVTVPPSTTSTAPPATTTTAPHATTTPAPQTPATVPPASPAPAPAPMTTPTTAPPPPPPPTTTPPPPPTTTTTSGGGYGY